MFKCEYSRLKSECSRVRVQEFKREVGFVQPLFKNWGGGGGGGGGGVQWQSRFKSDGLMCNLFSKVLYKMMV